MTSHKRWLVAGLLLASTGLLGGLWAQSGSAGVSITAANPGGSGHIATITALTPSTYTVAKGNAQVIQGVDLYDVTNIYSGMVNQLTFRFYILNPHEMGDIFTNPNAYLNVKVTHYTDATTVYASGMMSREKAAITLSPSGVPSGTTELKVRADIVVPGGRPPGAQEKTVSSLSTFLEVSQR